MSFFAQDATAVSEMVRDLIAATSVFLPGTYTVATLPPPMDNLDKYAIVTDLWGDCRDVVKAFKSGSSAYWRPTNAYSKPVTVTGGTFTIMPLVTPSSIFMTGTLTANLLVSISTTRAWPGQEQFIGYDGTLGLFGIQIAGLGSLLNAGRRRFIFDGAAWQQG